MISGVYTCAYGAGARQPIVSGSTGGIARQVSRCGGASANASDIRAETVVEAPNGQTDLVDGIAL